MINCLLGGSTVWSCTQETQTKLEYPIKLHEVKKHLRMDADFVDDDAYLENLIKVAVTIAENYVEKNIAYTETQLRIDDFCDSWIKIHDGNFSSIKSILNASSVAISTSYTTYKHDNFFQIEWLTTITSDPVYINYYSGYTDDTIPAILKQAIFIIIADLYDSQRSNIDWQGYKDNKVWQTILDPYRQIRF